MSRRDIITVAQQTELKRRREIADIKYRVYVGPYGNMGLHIVKNRVDGQEFVVAGPSTTFKPGQIVPIGSNTGHQGEIILVEPPPGRRGSSPPRPPIIIVTPNKPDIDGDFDETNFTSGFDPWNITYQITGTSFDEANFIEFFDFRNPASNYVPREKGPVVITGTQFDGVDAGWSVTLQSPTSYNLAWRFRVFSTEGSAVFDDASEWLEDGSPEEGRWKMIGL